MWDDSNFREQG